MEKSRPIIRLKCFARIPRPDPPNLLIACQEYILPGDGGLKDGVAKLEVMYKLCVNLVALEQWEQVIVAVVREVRRTQVGQQLVWVGQLWEQLEKQKRKSEWGSLFCHKFQSERNAVKQMTHIKTRFRYITWPPRATQAKAVCVQPGILVGVAWMHGSSWSTHGGTSMERWMLLLLLLLLLEGVVGWVHATRVRNLQKRKVREMMRKRCACA